MLEIIGAAMFYSWIHSVIIVSKKLKGATQYEKGVLVAGLVGFILYLAGTL